MTSSAKFIDYFVHDILDYTVLTNDINNFIKNFTIFDIRDAIQEISQILEDKADMKGINISFDYVNLENEFIIKTDVKRFQQVLLNLFSNAVKFTDRFGEIVIKASYSDDKRAVSVQVSDNGVGIKEEDKPKLFKLFGSIKDEKR